MTMPRTILAATDFSSGADCAVRYAFELAQQLGARVHLLHAYTVPALPDAVALGADAAGLIMAGALGNCYDRLVYGYVRDFVHFEVPSIGFDFAIFNFADNMLVLGAALLMLLALRPDPIPTPAPATEAVSSDPRPHA